MQNWLGFNIVFCFCFECKLCFSYSLFLFIFIVCDEFSHGLVLYNRQDVVINGSNYTIFIPEICITGSYGRLCDDDTHHPGLANDMCTSMGFACEQFSVILMLHVDSIVVGEPHLPSSYINYTAGPLPQGVLYMTQFTCVSTDENCQQYPSITSNPQCYAGELEFIVQCTNGSKLSLYTFITCRVIMCYNNVLCVSFLLGAMIV